MDHYRRLEASEHYERAISLERAGRIDEAIVEYRRAVDADPGFADAYEALGHHYRRRGLLTKALDSFEALTKLEASYSAYFNAGYILLELERYEEAEAIFRCCLELVPDDPTALYQIGYAHYARGQLAEALGALQRPLVVYARDGQVHNLVGDCYLGLGDWEAAERSYRRALEETLSPQDAQTTAAALETALRYQEFPPRHPLGIKEQVYADFGIVLVGTAGDDGLQISPRQAGPLSLEDIAVTLHRLRALFEAFQSPFTALVSIDRDSIPLVLVLEQILGIPRKRLAQLEEQDRSLLVLALGRQPELLQVALEQAWGEPFSFVLALNWSDRTLLLPDIVGIPLQGEGSLPWTVSADDPDSAETAAKHLLGAYEHTLAETHLEEQVRYYAERHCRLPFLQE